MTYLVEPAVTEDLVAIEALLPRLAHFEVPAHRQPEDLWHGDCELVRSWSHGARADVRVRVVRGDGGLLGVCVVSEKPELLTHAPSAHLEILAVAESAEGRGVARALLLAAQTEAFEAGATMMSLHVFANNERTRRVYEQAGFKRELLRYVKPLTAAIKQ